MNTGVIVHDADAQRDGKADQPTVPSWWSDLGRWFVDNFFRASELQIKQKHDRDGNLYWHVYDPITKHSARFISETEVRVWIEQSYQRQVR